VTRVGINGPDEIRIIYETLKDKNLNSQLCESISLVVVTEAVLVCNKAVFSFNNARFNPANSLSSIIKCLYSPVSFILMYY